MSTNPYSGVEYGDDPIPGLKIRWNSKKYCVVELDFWACPTKRDPEWAREEKQRYPDFRSWQREMCVRGSAKILTANLTWNRADSLSVGDELVGFQESLGYRFPLVRSVVESIKPVEYPPVKIVTTEGTVAVSRGHQFVVHRAGRGLVAHAWRKAELLRPGDHLLFFERPWETDRTYEAGWFAGFLDGEGWVSGKEWGFGQSEGRVLDRAMAFLQERGVRHSSYVTEPGRTTQGMNRNRRGFIVRVGAARDRMRALGMLQPIRLIENSAPLWEGRSTAFRDGLPRTARVISVKKGKDPETFWAIGTSSRTFLSDGFFSHNCRDWTMASGESFYPEFQFRQDLIVRKVPFLLPDRPVIRGWDFGAVNPACVWMQQAPSGRVAIFRETKPRRMPIHDFRDLVLFLSGQVDIIHLRDSQRELAIKELGRIEGGTERPYNKYPKPPWFDPGTRFIDFAGHEAIISRPIEGEAKERNDSEVLSAGGIQLESIYTRPSAREHAFRYLMGNLPDGGPGLLVDPACQLLIEGLGGGIAYKKPTPMDPEPTDVAKDGFYEHLHDAAGYPLAQIVKLADYESQPKEKRWRGRTLVEVDDLSSIGWSTDPSRYGRFV